MSIKLTPLEDKIIVKQAEAQTQTASGLFIPDLREGSRKLLPPNAQPCLLCIKVHARNVVEFGVAPHLHWVTDWGPYGRGSVGDLAERLKTFCTRRQ